MVKDAALTTVLRGDVITVSASLSCLDSLTSSINILALELRQNSINNASDTQTTTELSSPPIFVIKGSETTDSSCNFLRSTQVNEASVLSTTVALKKGETYANSVDILCLETPSPLSTAGASAWLMSSTSSPPAGVSQVIPERIKISMGNIYVNWCLDDDELLSPWAGDDHWLPSLERKNSESEGVSDSPVIRESSVTRLCTMVFSIPAVQVIGAPFDVAVYSPSVGCVGEIFEVLFEIKNKLWTVEKIILRADLNENFLITAGTLMSYDVCNSFCENI